MSNTPLFSAPRGMRDFYPSEMQVRNAIFDAWISSARKAGFEQYDACVVESLDLLKRKGGEEIVEQLYAFTDKSDRALALRAEMTPSLARMIVARQNELAFPLKWFAIAQCFRYERMSRGRKREHFQWNLDIIGETSLMAEAEIISTALAALARLGLGPEAVRIHINNRALLAELLLQAGIPAEHHAATFLALDKRGKIEDQDIHVLLRDNGLSEDSIAAAFRILQIHTLEEAQSLLGTETPGVKALRDLFQLLDTYGLGSSAVFDISVIRGLGYYTGIVFEGFDAQRSLRAIFGGGRYDNLLGDIGGRPATAVGLGFGDVVVAELLADKNLTPDPWGCRDMAIAYMDEHQKNTAIQMAHSLRKQGRSVDLGLHPEKPKSFFARVGKGAFSFALYLGPDDIAKGVVRIKDLTQRSESDCRIEDLLAGRNIPFASVKNPPGIAPVNPCSGTW